MLTSELSTFALSCALLTYFSFWFRDSIIFACVNSGTSFYGGFVIFSVLGFMAQKQGVKVEDVAKGGKNEYGVYPRINGISP